jgi:hypothetical protein
MIVRHNASRLSALGAFSGAGSRALFDKYENVEMRGFGGAFGAFDPPTAAVGVIAKVRLAYGAGGALQKIFPLDWQDALSRAVPVVDLLIPGILTSPSKGALAKSYKDLGAQIDDWAGRKYRWASQGKRDDGTAYSWEQWAELGKVYLNSAIYQSSLPVTDGFAANALTAIADFIDSFRRVFTPTEWPTWAKVAAVIAGAGVIAYTVNTFRASTR